MKIDYLRSLKKLVLTAGMVTSLSILTGCGDNESPIDNLQSKNVERGNENNDSFVSHEHLIIKIGDQTVIFRECDDEIKDISFICISNSTNNYERYYSDEVVSYEVINNNDEIICSGKTSDRWLLEEINSEYMEKVAQTVEDAAILEGAILYRGLGK